MQSNLKAPSKGILSDFPSRWASKARAVLALPALVAQQPPLLSAGEKLAPLNSSSQAASSEEPLKPCKGTAATLSVISRSGHHAQRPAGTEEGHRER